VWRVDLTPLGSALWDRILVVDQHVARRLRAGMTLADRQLLRALLATVLENSDAITPMCIDIAEISDLMPVGGRDRSRARPQRRLSRVPDE
jgi:hypothetical protein